MTHLTPLVDAVDLGDGHVLGNPRGYLNTAAEGLPLVGADQAMQSYLIIKGRGSDGRRQLDDIRDQTCALVGTTIGVDAADVAFVASTSRGLDIALQSVDWQAGDNLVFGDTEFPTIAFSSTLLAQQGVQARVIPSRDGVLDPADYLAQIDDRTRLVVVSLVSYRTGQLLDPATICDAAHQHGALVFGDAVQAMGAVEVDAGDLDYLCAGTFKWLGGVHGVALFYANPQTTTGGRPPYASYRGVTDLFAPDRLQRVDLHPGARRFEEGMPNYLAIGVLHSSLSRLRDIGIPRIQRHNCALGERLIDGLQAQGIRPVGPKDLQQRSSIVSFRTTHESAIGAALAERGTTVWARDGSVRLSAHLYSTPSDIDDALTQLDQLRIQGLRVADTQP